jgi:hypothetical protein
MTISIAWVRHLSAYDELVFVSDSRLGDTFTFDSCPKILTLPRNDCAISFAGNTGIAFPMMLQLNLAIASYAPALRRGVKLSAVKQHALKVFDKMYEERRVSPHVHGSFDTRERASFLFGGYSWFKKKFQLWKIEYSDRAGKFQARPAEWACFSLELKKVVFRRKPHLPGLTPLGELALAGDQAEAARKLLFERLTASHTNKIDFEPFEVVRDMLRDPALRDQEFCDTIGGAPQVVKVYQYMNAAPIGVYWPRREDETQRPYLHGRPCLAYENIDSWVLDPDTLKTERAAYVLDEIESMAPEAELEMADDEDDEPADDMVEDSDK